MYLPLSFPLFGLPSIYHEHGGLHGGYSPTLDVPQCLIPFFVNVLMNMSRELLRERKVRQGDRYYRVKSYQREEMQPRGFPGQKQWIQNECCTKEVTEAESRVKDY